jgi:hypothetical protein
MSAPTPETDALRKSDEMFEDVSFDDLFEAVAKLERERDEARQKQSDAVVNLHSFMDANAKLRKVADELAADLKTWWEGYCSAALNSYNQLPHVIERNKPK